MQLYSHKFEDGRRLELKEHLNTVARISADIISKKRLSFTLPQETIEKIAYLIGICHDFGKATSFFQRDRLEKNSKRENTGHSKLSAFWSYIIVKKYLEKKDISKNWKPFLRLIVPYIIERHHSLVGDLEHIKNIEPEFMEHLKKNLEPEIFNYNFNYNGLYVSFETFKNEFDDMQLISRALKKEYREFVKIGRNEIEEVKLEKSILFLLLFSILMEADKARLILEKEVYENESREIELQYDIVDKYKKEIFGTSPKDINKIREEAYQDVVSRVSDEFDLNKRKHSITLPTGTGKTLTSLSFALKLRNRVKNESSYAPKIIYSLPFLSIIEQTEEVFKEVLKSEIKKHTKEGKIDSNNRVLLKHHSLSEIEYVTKINDRELDINKSEFLINIWNSEIILTTFDQVLYSAFSRNRSFIMRFHNLFNSILIFDEVQSIPHHLWYLIKEFFQIFTKVGNTHIILMTATKPLIFKEKEEIYELVSDVKHYFDYFDRVNLLPSVRDTISFDEFKNIVLKTIEENQEKDIMVVLNTIESSIEMFEFLDKNLANKVPIYLSSNITPRDRIERINLIKDKKIKNKIIVTTQCIEAGVDIDVDIIFRDFAPQDSINQVCGRCNRNDKKNTGQIYVFRVINEKEKEFSGFIYHSFLLGATEDILKERDCIKENDFYTLNDAYFKKVDERKSNAFAVTFLESLSNLDFSNLDIRKELRGNLGIKETIFVIKDSQSKRIFESYREILEEEDWKKKREELLKIRRGLAENSISVTVNNGMVKRKGEKYSFNEVVSELKDTGFYYIKKDSYDDNIGFVPTRPGPREYIF